ncbi:hypothetical protein SprV_0702286100 [Sparganum proliferum]
MVDLLALAVTTVLATTQAKLEDVSAHEYLSPDGLFGEATHYLKSPLTRWRKAMNSEDKIVESQYLRRVFRENGYPRNFVNRCMRKRDERQNRANPKFWRAIPYIKNVSEAVSRLLAPLGVEVGHGPEATMRRQVMRPKDPLLRQETSEVVYRIWCSCGQGDYVGETGRLLLTRIAEHVAAVRRNDAKYQVAAHSTRHGHTFKFDEAEILARWDNRVSRE